MRPRVIVVEQVTYQGGEPTLGFSQPPYSRDVQSDEQPYQRVMTIGEEWQLLDFGWIKDNCGMLLVANKRPQRSTYPTPDEARAVEDAVIEFTVGGLVFGYVPVGEDCRICPVGQWQVRCRKGKAQIVVTAIPK